MRRIENQIYDEERAWYGCDNVELVNCRFDGPADGESACKEAKRLSVRNCFFNLRYPFWHDDEVQIEDSELTSLCRAALWYSKDITIRGTKLHGIKALRECGQVTVEDCDIVSPEVGWSVTDIKMKNSKAVSEYFMMRSSNLIFENVELQGKYSFQYIENAEFVNCRFDTKDAFWHSKHVVVRDSVVKGEYLAWYAQDITFINCQIIGTQPFCYDRELKLIGCQMLETDLAFEKSDVEATITTPVLSVKNPRSGHIVLPSAGEIIMDDEEAKGTVEIKSGD